MINQKPLKPIIGEVDCLTPGCGHAVPVRQNSETKALSFSCMWCGSPAFAKADGSAHYHATLARMRPAEASQDVPVAKPPAAPGTSQHVPAPTPPAPAGTSQHVPVAPPAAPKRATTFG